MGTLTRGPRDRTAGTLHAKSDAASLAAGPNVWVEDRPWLPVEHEHGEESFSCIESRQGRKKIKSILEKRTLMLGRGNDDGKGKLILRWEIHAEKANSHCLVLQKQLPGHLKSSQL